MVKFICYHKCTTCAKAKKWLDENGIEYTERDIKSVNPSADELRTWYQKSGLPLKKFFNTSGLLYKSMDLKTKLPNMTEQEMLELLFMVTQLFRTAGAGETLVGGLGEAFRIPPQQIFPLNEQSQRNAQQAPGVEVGDKQQRREHHGEIPVVDAAGGAAAVLHQEGLEGAEKQHADQVGQVVEGAQQHQR